MKFCKGFPLRRVHTRAYHLGIGLGLGLDVQMSKTEACRQNLLPNSKWKVQNKNLQGIPPQKRSHTGRSRGFRVTWVRAWYCCKDSSHCMSSHPSTRTLSISCPPRQTPRKLNSQQLTVVGNSLTQQYLVWSHKRWRQRNIHSCESVLSCRTFSPLQMSGDKYFVEAVISLPKVYWASILCQRNLPLTFTQEWTNTFVVSYQAYKHKICPSNWKSFHWSSQVWYKIAIGQPCSKPLQQRGCLDYTSRKKVPSGRGRNTSYGLDSLSGMYTSARCDAGLPFSMPSNPTRSMCQLQALHGNEAKYVDFIMSQPVGWTQNAIMREHGVWQWNISLCIPSNGNGARH